MKPISETRLEELETTAKWLLRRPPMKGTPDEPEQQGYCYPATAEEFLHLIACARAVAAVREVIADVRMGCDQEADGSFNDAASHELREVEAALDKALGVMK
jgi:hypothetical protein